MKKLNHNNTLEFSVQWDYSIKTGYGWSETRQKYTLYHNLDKFLEFTKAYLGYLNNQNPNKCLTVTNKIKTGIFKSKYIAIFDCDVEVQLPLICVYLDMNNTKYEIIESSPTRYWVIADKSHSNKNTIYNFVLSAPGIDRKWIDMCGDRASKLHLRATSKIISNKYSIIQPKFPLSHNLTDPFVIKWYEAFKHFHEFEWSKLYKLYTMHIAVGDGNVLELISNPNWSI